MWAERMPADPPRPASSEDIPRAVEFLINLVLRGVCFLLAGISALVALIAWFAAWSWRSAPLILAFVFFAGTFAFRPRGKMVFDRVVPSVIVPKPPEPERAGDR
jgi:hypothetical protein